MTSTTDGLTTTSAGRPAGCHGRRELSLAVAQVAVVVVPTAVVVLRGQRRWRRLATAGRGVVAPAASWIVRVSRRAGRLPAAVGSAVVALSSLP